MTVSEAGDFSFWDGYERDFLKDAYDAITETNQWEFFRTHSPPESKGYMFWSCPELKEVETHMKLINQHSGASFGWTMRNMQSIARDGWVSWVSNVQN